ncbi:hypothetical protein [Metaclostridioides mangenotii]|nr:hypothetical protein [Clostridioides mangenotii]
MLKNLAYIWTFIGAGLNVLGFADINWWIVILPSVLALAHTEI